ncbi:hypothetical protein HY388_02510 [Candidatus Daviesbacteria bacterium]|nr:hypothetical protein [Candidatus Daviesbacteria bacterium]
MRKKVLVFVSALIFLYPVPALAQSTADTLSGLNDKIRQLQEQIAQSKNTQQTLSSQIAAMDRQIQLTTLKISQAKQKVIQLEADIGDLSKKIVNLEASLDKITNLLLERIVATYEESKNNDDIQLLFSSASFGDLISRYRYLQLIQSNDKKLLLQMQATKNNYQDQKTLLQDKQTQIEAAKKELERQEIALNQQRKDKENLLQVTKNDEKRYQKLLQEAQAQVQAFKSFASSKGGVAILPAQASPDGWYYNQRDERWGRSFIGSSPEQIWDVGCLVTSVAMVLKQSGNNVTPLDIAANSSYYFASTAYMLIPWGGGKFSSVWGYNKSSVDGMLSSGKPVVVGLRAGVYGMHFVVLKSGAGGNYIMNDPWNGANLKFTDYYSTGQIFEYGFYNG